MIESLRRFSVTKLLSSPALPSLLSSLFSLPVQAVAGKKARTSAADSLTAAPDGGKGWRKAKGGKRCNAISGSTILKPLLFSSVEDRGVKSFELKRDSIAPLHFFFIIIFTLYTMFYTMSLKIITSSIRNLFLGWKISFSIFLKNNSIRVFIDVGPKKPREMLNRWRELEKEKKGKKRGHRDRRTNGRLISFDSSHFPPLQYGQEGCVRSHLGLLIISRG